MLITLEGIEGSGKTTQIKSITRFLQQKGRECITTREPGATKIGNRIRSILLDPDSDAMEPQTELLLYMADRSQHVREIITPALSAGKTVVCDRFFDATVVYQGYARGLDIDVIQTLHRLLLDGIRPDITFLLDLSPDIGLKRAWKQINGGSRTHSESRFEREALQFHNRVRSAYLDLARSEPERFRIIDAAQDPERVRQDILLAMSLLYN